MYNFIMQVVQLLGMSILILTEGLSSFNLNSQ